MATLEARIAALESELREKTEQGNGRNQSDLTPDTAFSESQVHNASIPPDPALSSIGDQSIELCQTPQIARQREILLEKVKPPFHK